MTARMPRSPDSCCCGDESVPSCLPHVSGRPGMPAPDGWQLPHEAFPFTDIPFVVEQIAAKFDLGRTHRVAGWNGRQGRPFWEIPLEVRGEEAGGEGNRQCKPAKQRPSPSAKCHIRQEPLTCAGAWRAAKRRGKP